MFVNLINNTRCQFNATVRVHGDVKDHIKMIDGNIYSSLNIRLNSGNIESIIKFILLLPETRNNDNEIFASILLKELGFISPRTKYLNLKFNGQKNKFIFQEKITKELLENVNLTEGPIVEASQRFVWPESEKEYFDERFTQGRMVNEAWAIKNEETFKFSLIALTKFNQTISQDTTVFNLKDINNGNQLYNETNFAYDTILTAMNAIHGLGPRDRKFYFDPLNLVFLPIYYDGNANIINKITDDNFDKNNTNIFAYKGVDSSLKLLNNLDINKLLEKLNNSGLIFEKKDLRNTVDRIRNNIIKIKNAKIKNDISTIKKQYFSRLDEDAGNKRLVFYKENLSDEINSFIVCEFNLNNCREESLNFKEIYQLVSGKLKKKENYYIFVSNNITDYEKGIHNKNIENLKREFKTLVIDEFGLILSKNFLPSIDNENKILTLNQVKSDDVAIFQSGKLKDWEINFIGAKKKSNINYNFYFNGCLIFHDVHFENVKINVEDTNCEDGTNLINSSGKIKYLKVSNSFSDGIDMDFSNIEVEEIFVDQVNNDCLDVSYGNYNFKRLNLKNCGDKGVSIGEKSKVASSKIMIENTGYGFVVKDSSIADIEDMVVNTSKICFSAYNKKQMFYGGVAKIKNLICENYNKDSDVDYLSSFQIDNYNNLQ